MSSSQPAPVPILATYSQTTGAIVCTFDQALQAGISQQSNWNGTTDALSGHQDFELLANLTIAGATVSGTEGFLGPPSTPSNVLNYFAVPPDVRSIAGIPVAAFSNFPLTIIP